MEIADHVGNLDLLKLHKTAFLCSRRVPASVVLKCYDWALARREAGDCVISGFHSKLEKDVLHYLLKGTQPVILALARGLKDRIDPELKRSLDQGQLLIITPFDKSVKRITAHTAQIRNQMMVQLADQLTIGYASKGGMLESLIMDSKKETNWLK